MLAKHYKELYEKAGTISQQTDEAELELFASLISAKGNKLDILDMGCAEGRLVVALAHQGHNVTAADISHVFLDRTAQLANQNNVNVKTNLCDIESNVSAFRDARFDVIYFMDIIEHLRNPLAALTNVRELLNDKGILIINTPNICTPARLLGYIKRPKRLSDFFDPKNLGDLHLNSYDYFTLEKLLNFAGLKIVQAVPNKVTLPILYRISFFQPLFRLLSRIFPFLSDNLLVKCKKVQPIDVEKQIEYWRENLAK